MFNVTILKRQFCTFDKTLIWNHKIKFFFYLLKLCAKTNRVILCERRVYLLDELCVIIVYKLMELINFILNEWLKLKIWRC